MISRARKLLRWSLFGVVFLLACNGSSSSPLPAPAPEPEPPAPPPPYSLSLIGGAATGVPDELGYGGQGGAGGTFQLLNMAGGDVQVLATGTVDTTVTLPTALPYLGTNWQDITADTTVSEGTSGFRWGPEYTLVNDDGPVTGLWVRPGVTLTMKPNIAYTHLRPDSALIYELSDGIIVEGTVKVAPMDSAAVGDGLGPDTSNLFIGMLPEGSGGYAGGLYVGPSGMIDLSGASSAEGAGANGGSFIVAAEAFNNRGTITTVGGAGSDGGGAAGYVDVSALNGYAVTTGSILADGGAGGFGAGGSAGWINFGSGSSTEEVILGGYYDAVPADWSGFTVANGVLSATGGAGAAGGANGNTIMLFTNAGVAVASAEFRMSGGDATYSGAGGGGGSLFVAACGTIRLAGSVDAHGGAGMGTGNGGAAGGVGLVTFPARSGGPYGDLLAPDLQGIFVGADIVATGGAGVSGGAGGFFLAEALGPLPDSELGAVGSATIAANPIVLLRYESIDSSGADGFIAGHGAARDPDFFSMMDLPGNVLMTFPGSDASRVYHLGSVVNEADFMMRGGNSSGEGEFGGSGGALTMATTMASYAPYNAAVTNSGSVDAAGGEGDAGGYGGYAMLWGQYKVDNSGAITTSGGTGRTLIGGIPGAIGLRSSASLTSSGALTSSSGSTTEGYVTPGGDVSLEGVSCTVSGALTANGGNNTTDMGGDGGTISVRSVGGASSVVGTVSVVPGTGATGTPVQGTVTIDGMVVSGPPAVRVLPPPAGSAIPAFRR